jgi:hypothetical protein
MNNGVAVALVGVAALAGVGVVVALRVFTAGARTGWGLARQVRLIGRASSVLATATVIGALIVAAQLAVLAQPALAVSTRLVVLAVPAWLAGVTATRMGLITTTATGGKRRKTR